MINILSRILHGDFIYTLAGALGCCAGAGFAHLIKPKRWRIVAGVVLAIAGMILAHMALEWFMYWYTAPLGPPLELH